MNPAHPARFFAALAIAAGLPAAAQNIIHVNGTCGDNSWTGLSPVCAAPDGPKRSIREALAAAVSGDTVLVADGIYAGISNNNLGFNNKLLTLRSQNGPGNCIIDAAAGGRAFFMADFLTPATVIEGFTIRNGRGQPGGAFWFHHHNEPTIRNCILASNTSNLGGAVYTETDAGPTFINCTFTGNSAAQGGALAVTQMSRATLINCIFSGNTATSEGGAILVNGAGAATFINSTITANSAASLAGGLRLASGTAQVHNSILWANTALDGPQAAVGTTNFTSATSLAVSYSIVQGGPAAIPVTGPGALNFLAGNLTLDPLFFSSTNLRLQPGSPAIDAANNTLIPVGILTDLAGAPRFTDDPATPDTGIPGGAGGPAIADMGAHEFQPVALCYPNCDASSIPPILNVADFICFLNAYAAGSPYANCDHNTAPPILNVNDFICFSNAFAAGCP